MKIDPTIAGLMAPSGTLRASINLGNPILANRDEAGRPYGISIDLAQALAQRLNLPLELVVLESAGESVEAVASGAADIGFFAVDPKRGQQIAFTAPYVLIEGAYLVRHASRIVRNEEVDQPGLTVTVGKGSAYDLYLSRALRHATIVRAPTSPAVVDDFLEHGHEVAAGVRQQLEADCRRHAGLRILPGRFMVIRQAMGVSQARDPAVAHALAAFVEEAKASGFVAESMARHGVQGATVAPAG